MSTSTHLSCGMQDAQLDNWLDLVLSYAPQITCPECRATFFALKGNGDYVCPDCGLALVVDLTPTNKNTEANTRARGIGR